MDVTIIGTGNMARGVATRALAGGHALTLLEHSPGKAAALAAELSGDVATGSAADAPDGDVIVLALHHGVGREVAARHADALAGKVVVDISNAVDFARFEPLAVAAGSAAQEIAAAAPGARVVKAFNTIFAGRLAGEDSLDVFLAGDDADAKAVVARLVTDGGMRAIDAGPLARARELEALGFLHMATTQSSGAPFASAIALLP